MGLSRRAFVTQVGCTGGYTAALATMQSLGVMTMKGQAPQQISASPGNPSAVGRFQLQLSPTVKPSDTSTSIVIHPDPSKQIVCGKVPLTTYDNVVYSTPNAAKGGRSLRMDILVSKTPGRKPLVVYAAGGGFVMANKESDLMLRTYVAEAGFVVASIEYRTVRDGATYREGVADMKSAIRFLRSTAEQYSIDPDDVGVWGQSAGGYIVAMVGVTNNDKAFDVGDHLDQSSSVKAVVDKFGPSDVSKVDADYNGAQNAPARRALYVNGFLPDGGLRDPVSSPINHIAPSDVAFLIFHGSHDGLVSPSQTLIFHNALLAAGVNSKRYVLEGANHGDLTVLGDKVAGLPWSSMQTMDLIVDFFRTSLAF
ncbi:alpha/beta hydrolase [Granulicella mallensis]|uniref:Acetyl esterase/lipase n=1 Tax=Granulicella mallensis TaxID=940614 RepID=A0A7W8E8L3_9BACT|nr:alpha/beta hydrolase [Granulicella mallensis]MBB5062659.1 acetyl esterase/lipase [Granulicella mallensis]